MKKIKTNNLTSLKRGIIINILLFILLLVIFLIGCNVGQYHMTVLEVFKTLIGKGDK